MLFVKLSAKSKALPSDFFFLNNQSPNNPFSDKFLWIFKVHGTFFIHVFLNCRIPMNFLWRCIHCKIIKVQGTFFRHAIVTKLAKSKELPSDMFYLPISNEFPSGMLLWQYLAKSKKLSSYMLLVKNFQSLGNFVQTWFCFHKIGYVQPEKCSIIFLIKTIWNSTKRRAMQKGTRFCYFFALKMPCYGNLLANRIFKLILFLI